MNRWPALRTRRGGLKGLTLPKLIAVMVISLLAPSFLGILLFFSATPVGELFGYAGDGPIFLAGAGLMLIYSPMLAWLGMIPGIPLFLLALSRGWAGWVSALIAGGVIGQLIAVLVDASILFSLFGAINAGIFWIFFRWLHPRGLLYD